MKLIFILILMMSLQAFAEAPEVNAESGSATEQTAAASVSSTPEEIQIEAPQIAVENPVADKTSEETSIKNLKETEIPVQLEANKKAETQGNPWVRVLFSLAIVGVMGCAAYFLLRKYRFSNNGKSQATQIKVLSQHYLGPKKSLAIVRVAGESVLIGITDSNISMIKSLSLLDEDIPEETPKEFHTVFSKKTKAQDEFVEESNAANESRDDFSISGIKDFVSVKLKNMRSLE